MLLDRRGRPMGSLRLSVTDRCNLRCQYCMPEEEYRWLNKPDLLRFEELARLAGLFRGLGVGKLRLTGGEPLLRQQLSQLVSMLAPLGFEELAMTSNGVLLPRFAEELRAAGLQRVTVSIDTLQADRFLEMTRRDELARVLQGIESVRGWPGLKLDTVLLRGRNEDELFALVDYARGLPAEIRFIEYMDVAGATNWHSEDVISQAEILARLASHFGGVEAVEGRGSAPAQRFRLPHGQVVGVIASVSQPFCADCDRLRLTADGQLYLCLYARTGVDLRTPLREGWSDAELVALIEHHWVQRDVQGAVDRARQPKRTTFVSIEELRANPRLEMHTRGG